MCSTPDRSLSEVTVGEAVERIIRPAEPEQPRRSSWASVLQKSRAARLIAADEI